MGNKSTYKVVLIGAGNLGYHLGQTLSQTNVDLIQVFSRKISKAKKLAKSIQSSPINDLSKINTKADLYIICVQDNAILEVVQKLSKRKALKDKLFVHTSGATPSLVFKNYFKHYGIFYPLQSFSKGSEIDFKTTPFCIDAKYLKDKKKLLTLAAQISEKVYEINDDQRAVLHVAAVFANNFTNHLFGLSKSILDKYDLPFDIMRPIILETAKKVQENNPNDMQTGPAIRGDYATLEKHLKLLEGQPELSSIYLLLTESLSTS